MSVNTHVTKNRKPNEMPRPPTTKMSRTTQPTGHYKPQISMSVINIQDRSIAELSYNKAREKLGTNETMCDLLHLYHP